MLQNAYLIAKIGADTAENERNFAENLPKIGNYPTGPRRDGRDVGAIQRQMKDNAMGFVDTTRRSAAQFSSSTLQKGLKQGVFFFC